MCDKNHNKDPYHVYKSINKGTFQFTRLQLNLGQLQASNTAVNG